MPNIKIKTRNLNQESSTLECTKYKVKTRKLNQESSTLECAKYEVKNKETKPGISYT